jgi:hypothetical protein
MGMPTAANKWRQKRHFTKTAEPSGKAKLARAKYPRFVVQKHAGRCLHYDLRVEVAGVFKSRALTKGPSLETVPNRPHLGDRGSASASQPSPLAQSGAQTWSDTVDRFVAYGTNPELARWHSEGNRNPLLMCCLVRSAARLSRLRPSARGYQRNRSREQANGSRSWASFRAVDPCTRG